jgi:hypothetical protein
MKIKKNVIKFSKRLLYFTSKSLSNSHLQTLGEEWIKLVALAFVPIIVNFDAKEDAKVNPIQHDSRNSL